MDAEGGGEAEISGVLTKAAGDPPPCNGPYRGHRAISHNPKVSLWAGVGHQGAAEVDPALGSCVPSPPPWALLIPHFSTPQNRHLRQEFLKSMG